MIRSHKSEQAAMKLDVQEFERRLVVDVIEVQKGHYSGVSSRPSNTLFRFGRVEAVTEQMRREPPGPLVEITKNDTRR